MSKHLSALNTPIRLSASNDQSPIIILSRTLAPSAAMNDHTRNSDNPHINAHYPRVNGARLLNYMGKRVHIPGNIKHVRPSAGLTINRFM